MALVPLVVAVAPHNLEIEMVDVNCGAIKCANNRDGKCVAESINVARVQGKPLASCKSFSAPSRETQGIMGMIR